MAIKLPSRYQTLLFALIMSFSMALLVSGVISLINAPSIGLFLQKWLPAFLMAWPLVFLAIVFIAPLVQRIVNGLVEK